MEKGTAIGALLVAVVCLAVVAQVTAQPTPFVISGWIFTSGGEPCNNPCVEITNTNTGESWDAENQSTFNYYQLVLNGSGDVSAGNLLRFNVSGCSQFKTVNHTVNKSEIDNGGLFEFNISLEAPQEIIWQGDVALINGTTFNVTAHNSETEYAVNSTTALGALDAAAEAGEFNYTVTDEWGFLFVDSIADIPNEGWNGWMYWVNYPDDPSPSCTADHFELNDSDVVTWYYGGMGASPDNTDMLIRIGVSITETTIPGDVNHDGSITTADAVLALRMAVGSVASNDAADVNSDGVVTSLDALMIMHAAAGANIT